MILGAAAGGLFGLLMTPGWLSDFSTKTTESDSTPRPWMQHLKVPWLGHGDINYLEFIFDTSNRYHTMFGDCWKYTP